MDLAFLDSDEYIKGLSYPNHRICDSVSRNVILNVHENLREHTYNSDTRNTIFGFISNCVGGLNDE